MPFTMTLFGMEPRISIRLSNARHHVRKWAGAINGWSSHDPGDTGLKEIGPDGSAMSSDIVPGDILLQVGNTDVTNSDFDTVMDLLIDAPSTVQLTVGDGLGNFDLA